jgi:hypothetical protein
VLEGLLGLALEISRRFLSIRKFFAVKTDVIAKFSRFTGAIFFTDEKFRFKKFKHNMPYIVVY